MSRVFSQSTARHPWIRATAPRISRTGSSVLPAGVLAPARVAANRRRRIRDRLRQSTTTRQEIRSLSLNYLIVNDSFSGSSAYLDLTGITYTPALKIDIGCLQAKGVTVVPTCADCGSTCPPDHVDPDDFAACSVTGKFYDCDLNDCSLDLRSPCQPE